VIRGKPDWTRVGSVRRLSKPSVHPSSAGYDLSRTYFRSEEEFPGPRTMSAAAQWLRENGRAHDRFFLFVDEFDPHEPFDTPEPWASLYDNDWEGPRVIWPTYAAPGNAHRARRAHRAPPARQLRLEVDDDRSLLRATARRARRPESLGDDGGHRADRPRSLSSSASEAPGANPECRSSPKWATFLSWSPGPGAMRAKTTR
jgi:hypothetical protein